MPDGQESSSPHAPRPVYPDHPWHGTVIVEENRQIARDTYLLRIGPTPIAARVVPGQFVMLRLPGSNDPLLGRPFALYEVAQDASGSARGLEIVYLVVGKMTRLLSTLPRDAALEVWGPLGNGFPPTPTEHLVMVAGGIGQTPFLALAREYLGLRRYGEPPRLVPPAKKVTLCYGACSSEYLAGVEDFAQIGVEVRTSTEDGSHGHRGLVTELIEPVIAASPWPCRMVCCGPEPMLKAAATVAARLQVPCQLSLESPMACGIGICFSCVARIRSSAGTWDYRRVCIEGPVFDARDVEL